MSLSVAVMAHRTREAFVPPLLDRLGVGEDRVVWDRRNDRWDTGRRAMLHHDPDCSHHLVLQDDAVVPPDLIAGVTEALGHVPGDAAVCLYTGKTRKFWDGLARIGVRVPSTPCWLVMGQTHWGVGIVLPTGLIGDMVTWCDRRREVPNYDKRISRWCESRQIEVWYPFPSLVDHRQSPSLVSGRGSRGRRAQRFIGADASALSQRWDRQVVNIPPLRRTNGQQHLPASMAGSSGNPSTRTQAVRSVRRMRRRRRGR